jgi:hypothetical protein
MSTVTAERQTGTETKEDFGAQLARELKEYKEAGLKPTPDSGESLITDVSSGLQDRIAEQEKDIKSHGERD